MNKEQQNKVLKGIYDAAITMMLKAPDDRHRAIYNYETYLETVEATIQVFNPSFDIECDLKLVSRGVDESTLRYVTRLDLEAQRSQLNFYQAIRNSL